MCYNIGHIKKGEFGMLKLFYSVNDIFISKFGYFKDGCFKPSYPYEYSIIEKKNGKYRSILPEVSDFYESYEKVNSEYKENICLWGKIESIYTYLTEVELKNKKISIWRLSEIQGIINGEVIDNTPRRVIAPGVLEFKSRL